jgi:hypothetical protein
MISKTALISLLVFTLGGCATFYTLEGQRYNSKEEFQRASESMMTGAVAQISPLPSPLTNRKLIFAMPTEQAISQETINRATRANGALNSTQTELLQNISKHNHRSVRAFFEAVQKRGIYSSLQLMELPSMVISIEPTSDTDVIYMTEPAAGSGQWFYASGKHGRQVFAYDRSGVGPAAKAQAFVDAAQLLAIRQ